MSWKIAEAKQNLSKVVRMAADEPQVIFHRDRPIAALIGIKDVQDFLSWKAAHATGGLSEAIDNLLQLTRDEQYDLPTTPRRDRRNAFRHLRRG